MRQSNGFSLIELIAVIVVISVGLAGLARMWGNASIAMPTGEEMQTTAQYAQECADIVLGTRRDIGFAALNTNLCDPAPTGYTRTVVLSNTYNNTVTSVCPVKASCPCPDNATCRDATITVSKGSASSDVKLMLVQ